MILSSNSSSEQIILKDAILFENYGFVEYEAM
jgi:hypothetical protein